MFSPDQCHTTHKPRSCLVPAQVTQVPGCYASGRVHVELLPAATYGSDVLKQFSLRRIERVASDQETVEMEERELDKVSLMGADPRPVSGAARLIA